MENDKPPKKKKSNKENLAKTDDLPFDADAFIASDEGRKIDAEQYTPEWEAEWKKNHIDPFTDSKNK